MKRGLRCVPSPQESYRVQTCRHHSAHVNSRMGVTRSTKDVDGLAKITESDAKELLNELTDSELEDGILFNTPEEVAELLMSV